MRIMIFGAGVLGCNMANSLFRAGKDVTLLARGKWAEQIKSNGLRIKNMFSPRAAVSRVPVVTELAPDDIYDVIFVAVRYTQLETVIDILKANGSQNIVFVGNNVRARETADRLPEKNMMFAFTTRRGTGKATVWFRLTFTKSP